MKHYSIWLVMVVTITPALAQEVIFAKDKASALTACQEQAKASPQALRREMLQACECVVEHTDFSAVNQQNEKGEEDWQALYATATAMCFAQKP